MLLFRYTLSHRKLIVFMPKCDHFRLDLKNKTAQVLKAKIVFTIGKSTCDF